MLFVNQVITLPPWEAYTTVAIHWRFSGIAHAQFEVELTVQLCIALLMLFVGSVMMNMCSMAYHINKCKAIIQPSGSINDQKIIKIVISPV